MELSNETILYFDTNALRSLGLSKIIAILGACRSGEISVTLSYWVIWEYARQQFFGETTQLIPLADMTEYISGKTRKESLEYYHLCNIYIFRDNGVNIIEHSADIENLSAELINDQDTYFSGGNAHDERDAYIFSSAIIHLNPKKTIVFCDERQLIAEFSKNGFAVESRAKEFFQEINFKKKVKNITALPQIIESVSEFKLPSLFHAAVQRLDPAFAALASPSGTKPEHLKLDTKAATQIIDDMAADDKEVRLNILTLVQWFGPILKEELVRMLQERQIASDLIAVNLDRLATARTIKDTGHHYIPGDDGVCAAIGYSRIGELADMLRGS